MLNIEEELKKIKKYLEDNITLGVDIVPNYDYGNKVSITCFYIDDDDKMRKAEYSFYIQYFKDKNNYANASYLLHCSYDYYQGGTSYADKYESLEDFKNSRMVKELIEENGRDKKKVQTKTHYEEMSLFDEINDDEDLIEEEDTEDSEDNQLSLFDEVDPVDNHVDLEDLLSYGVDDYYEKEFKGKCVILSKIQETLSKLPKYKEYYNKLKTYLENKLPVRDIDEVDFKEDRYVFMYDDVITVKENRCQSPIYCYKMYEKMLNN